MGVYRTFCLILPPKPYYMDLLNPSITISQISNIENYQLRENGVAKYLDLSDSDRTYRILKTLTSRQYHFLNILFFEKKYRRIAGILISQGLKPNPAYVDYLMDRQINN